MLDSFFTIAEHLACVLNVTNLLANSNLCCEADLFVIRTDILENFINFLFDIFCNLRLVSFELSLGLKNKASLKLLCDQVSNELVNKLRGLDLFLQSVFLENLVNIFQELVSFLS